MKSVFSAFKGGRKTDSSSGGSGNGGPSTIATKSSARGKSPISYENSYASLRQIRAADPFTKMSIASGDDLIDTCHRVPASTTTTTTTTNIDTNSIPDGFEGPTTKSSAAFSGVDLPASPASECESSAINGVDAVVDVLQATAAAIIPSIQMCDSHKTEHLDEDSGAPTKHTRNPGSGLIGDAVTSLPPAKPVNVDGGDGEANGSSARVPVLSAGDTKRLLKSGDLNTLRNSKNTNNRLGKRLSLTGLGNNLLPTVHGRAKTGATGTSAAAANGTEKSKARFSHQRNLSLDFRYGMRFTSIVYASRP